MSKLFAFDTNFSSSSPFVQPPSSTTKSPCMRTTCRRNRKDNSRTPSFFIMTAEFLINSHLRVHIATKETKKKKEQRLDTRPKT
ncbi:uncharacterized protein MYCFIDRAFT_211849, partial [Pseudocercospora fijiensis CIRAD86]